MPMTRGAARATGRRARERATRERDVVAAAERVFERSGFAKASMIEIAREAEFAIGTLYKLFPSKEALFERLLLDQLRALEARLEGAIAAERTALDRLEAFAAAQARFAVERRSFLALLASPAPGVLESPAAAGPEVLRAVARLDALLLSVVREGVARRELTTRIAPELVALAFSAATRAYLLERVIKGRGPVGEAEVRVFARTVVRGLGSRAR